MLNLGFMPSASACSTCGCTLCLLGKNGQTMTEGQDHKWYFRYLYDQVAWRQRSAEEANNLLNNDHDGHDKTTDVTHHYQLGRQVTDDFNVFFDLPYIVRTAIEFEDTANLGARQRSQGVGDLQLLGDYRVWHNASQAANIMGGIKFPTGSTHEKNFQGERFETDMQPGSGAYDYIAGAFYSFSTGRFSLTANTSYIFTTKGAQGFTFGDFYTVSALGEYLLNPAGRYFKTYVGLDGIFQDEWKERTNGQKNPDSGGQTVLLGPSLRINANANVNLTGSFLYPVSQDYNGLTQQQKFEWRVGAQVRF